MTAPAGDTVPALVDERFEVGPLLGQGGMATVFRAHDRTSGLAVALKVLRGDVVPALGRARFAREITLTGGMRHPGILQVIAVGDVGGRPYYAMPLVEGGSLRERLVARGALPIEEAVRTAAELADALSYAHARGVIHRDIKPANILLDGDRPLLADFGIARAVDGLTADRLTESGLAVGTAHYMSPEQASCDTVDARSDIYGLGCVLYEMLVGVPPFSGATTQQLLARHVASPVPRLREVRGAIPVELENIVLRTLEKVPADRFAGAGELAAALRGADTSQTARARVRRRWRSNRLPLVFGVSLAIGAAALTLIYTRPPRLDPNRVLVLPFVARSTDVATRSAGEDAATMIGAAIDGVGPLRWVDAWQLLDPRERQDIAILSAPAARALARRARAGYVISGRLVGRQDTVDVIVDLRDVAGDSVMAHGQASAPRAEAWRGALRAVNAVLPRLIRTGAPDVAAGWRDRSPRAVVAYLQGEAAYRRLQMAEALAKFHEAIGHDSLLTLAALRGAQAASWSHNAREAGDLARLALRQRLSPRDAHFARGVAFYVQGSADSSANSLRRAIALDPTMAVAWMQLGETLTHLLPRAGTVDSAAGAALERAHELDPTSGASAYHLAERSARAGDAVRTRALLDVMRAGQPDTLALRQIELMSRCVSGRGRRLDWYPDARARPLALLSAATKLAAVGAQLGCAADAFAATLAADTAATDVAEARRFAALIGLVGAHHAQGHVPRATAEIDRFIARWGAGSSLLIRQALVSDAAAARARGVARADSARFGNDFSRSPFPDRLWLLGVWAAREGRVEAALGAARELSRRADSTHQALDRWHAQSVLAHAAIAAHDTARGLALLTPLVGANIPGDELQWNEPASFADERLLLARLLLARGDPRGALAVANVFDSAQPDVFLLYLAPSLEMRLAAAATLGDGALAARFRARLAALRASPTPVR